MKRILLTGFDPFTLDRDIRISNPSGATALALDGTVIETADGPARVETAVFPVRWQDFTGAPPSFRHWEDGGADAAAVSAEGRPVHHGEPGPGRAVRHRADQRGLAGRLRGQRQHRPHRDRPRHRPGLAAAVDDDHAAVRGRSSPRTPAVSRCTTTRASPRSRRAAPSPSYGRTGRRPAPPRARAAAGTTSPTRSPTGRRCCGTGWGCTARCRAGMCTRRCCSSAPGTPREVTDPEFVRNRLDIIAQVRAILKVAAEQRRTPAVGPPSGGAAPPGSPRPAVHAP